RVAPRSSIGARGRCVDQSLNLLVTETGAAMACHVAAHHTFAYACLERLIDHAAVVEILDAPFEKRVQRQLLRCVLGGIQHAYHWSAAWTFQRRSFQAAISRSTSSSTWASVARRIAASFSAARGVDPPSCGG